MWVAGRGIEWFPMLKIEPSAGRRAFVKAIMNLHTALTLNLLTTTIVAPPSNASKWQMGFNLAFKGLKARSFFCNYAPSSFTRRCVLLWVVWHMMCV